MRTRIFACLLAALLLTPTLASCGNTDEKIGGEITTPDASNTQTETEEAETTLPSGVPEGTTFDGESVSIWFTATGNSVAETFINLAGENTGETLDDAIYYRNLAVEDLLDVKLDYFESDVTTDKTGATLEKLVMAGDTTYDITA